MNNSWRRIFFGVIFCGFLSACTTTYDAPKFTASSASDAPAKVADVQKRASLRLQLGTSYYQQGQYATALKELNSAVAIDPDLSDAYGVRALVYIQMQETKLAEQDFLRVMSLAPNNPDHINNYAWFLCQNGKEKQALEMLDRVIKDRTFTQPVKALNNAGMCSLKLKDDAVADGYFSQVIRFEVNNPIANLNLARLAYKKQDWARAQFNINRLIKAEVYTPEVLWMGIKVSHKLNDVIAESSLVVQLRRRFPDSDEYALFQHGAFDE